MSNEIIRKLEDFIQDGEQNKSSYWKLYSNSESNIKNPYKDLGFGGFYKKELLSSFFHYVLSVFLFGNAIRRSNTYRKYKKIFDESKRQIDVNTIRHIFTFEMLKDKIQSPKLIAIIGDGKCHAIIGSKETFPNAQIFSVNLAETLINDYLLIKEMNIYDDDDIQVIRSIDDKLIKNKKLVLISSSLKLFLTDKNIDLFINIASFQEMDQPEVENYFNLIKSNKSFFYCCNREYKKLPGGEESYFNKYPWGNVDKFFYEDCEWHQKYYSKKFPFIIKYNGKHKHCLVDYSSI
jgi:hypothetical protein